MFDYRDRAIIKFFLYSGARIGTACRLRVKDFHQDGDEATITLHEKGDKHRRIGLQFAAAEAIAAYIAKAELTKGPLFRARLNSRSQKLGRSPISTVTMYHLVQRYLARLPSSMREEDVTAEDGTVTKVKRCAYTPHSLRATTATLLLDAGVDIIKVKELLGHRHVTTTQIYGSRSHPESGCILNRLPRNPRYFSVNSWMIVNISYDRYLSSRTVVDFGSCEVFSMVFV